MGNQTAKGQSTNVTHVNPKELITIEKVLQKSTDIKLEDVNKLWRNMLTDFLLDCYSKYVFTKESKRLSSINLKSFVVLLNDLGRGTWDQQASILYSMLNSDKSVTENILKQYFMEVLLSCLKLLENKENKSYLRWKKISPEPVEEDLSSFVDYLCRDLNKNDILDSDLISQWLSRSEAVHLFHNFLLLHLYGLYQSKEAKGLIVSSLLPNLKLSPKDELVKSLLTIPTIMFLNQHLPAEFQKDWRLLFSSTEHGESFSIMMRCILDQGPTVIIVKDNDGYLFGGFATDSWHLGPKFYGDSGSFLFTLRPKFSICRSTGYNSHFMYINCNQSTLPNGLGMGGQFDYWGLWIDSVFGEGACSNSCTTYENYSGLSKEKNFRIAALQVWGVGIPPPTAAERGEREVGKSSILEVDAAASYILQAAGKTQHSDGLRDKPDDELSCDKS